MKRRVAAALAVAGLAAAGHAMDAPQRSGSSAVGKAIPSLDRVAMRSTSFWMSATTGSPFNSEWRIDRSGEGTFRSVEARRDERNKFHQDVVTRRLSVGGSGFRRIERLLQPAEAYAGGRLPCEGVPYSDSTLGKVSWTRGATTRHLRFDQGCPDKIAKRIFDRMDEAEALISKWAAKGAVVRSEPLPKIGSERWKQLHELANGGDEPEAAP